MSGREGRVRIAVGVAAPALLIVALTWPMLWTDATFSDDWLNHLWLMWHQSRAIASEHHPSLFLDYSGGVLYPFYAFYGGTLYALCGALSLALGDAPLQSYVLTYLLSFAAAYGGWYWMARGVGVGSWRAHMPGLIFVTSAFYLTTIYGLGDWPELVAVSAMPPMTASALSVLRAPHLRIGPALALLTSTALFFGSHLLTAIWGTTLLGLLAAAILLCVPQTRRDITRAGVVRLLAIAVPAALVDAWFLLPTVAYESHTVIAHAYHHFRGLLRSTMYTVAARHLFTLSRARDSGTVLTLALPLLTIAWVLGAIAIALATRAAGTWRRLLLLLAGASAALLIVMTHASAILALPRIYATLQFSFRLEGYVLMGISGALLAALVLAERTDGPLCRWRLLLAPIALVSLIGAIQQVASYGRGGDRGAALRSFLTPPTPEQEWLLDYVDDELPIMRARLPRLSFPARTLHGAGASVPRAVGTRRLLDTNLRSGPELLSVSGARIVGTDAHADDVLEVDPPSAHPGGDSRSVAARVDIRPASAAPIVAGRVTALAAILVLAVELVWIAVGRGKPR